MFKKSLLVIFLFSYSFSFEILSPTFSLKAEGYVQDILYDNHLLYAANSNGSVEIFDIKTKNVIKTIEIPNIKDFAGDIIPAKIYSIDFFDNKLLIVSQGQKGYRNLWIYQNNKLTKIFDTDKKYLIQKASFLDESRILFAQLSNQIIAYNIATKQNEYLIQISNSAFSHYKLSENRQTFATTDESGVVKIIDSNTGKVLKVLKALNLDRVYQLDYKNGTILTSGQDRKAAVYFKNDFKSYNLHFDFLLYSCALNQDSSYGAISYNEQNNILIFDVMSKEYLFNLVGQNATSTQILFINKNELFASSDSEIINFWKF